MQTINFSNETCFKLKTPMPDYIHKTKQSLTYVSGQSVIDKLNATFGFAGWSWEIKQSFIKECEDKVIKTKYENGKKVNLSPDKWIYEKQMPVCHVIGRLTVYTKLEDGTVYSVFKDAPGAQCLVGGQSEQENCFKGAHTDALKKAATLFGIALELYRDENEKFFHEDLHYDEGAEAQEASAWTEDFVNANKDKLDYIAAFKSKFSLSESDMNYYISDSTKGVAPTMEYLVPEMLDSFVEYLKKIDEDNSGGN